jgi:hypothetical protein
LVDGRKRLLHVAWAAVVVGWNAEGENHGERIPLGRGLRCHLSVRQSKRGHR